MSQKNRFLACIVVLLFVLQTNICFAKKFDDEGFKFFKWDNPSPIFKELGLNLENIHTILGNGQLCISHKGRDIKLWTNNNGTGDVKTYKNARFVTSLAIFNTSREELIKCFTDFKSYPKMMKQFTEGEIIKSEGNQHLVRLKQVYKVIIVKLVADFRYLYTIEENGDLSALLLDGDVGAGVMRIEFIPISENQTLVVSSSWVDLDSARFMYRTLIKAQPDVKPTAPLGAVAMLTDQFRSYIDKDSQEPPKEADAAPTCPIIPTFNTGHIPITTMRHLSDLGTLVFIHPKQWIKTKDGVKDLEFVSSIAKVKENINLIKPYSSDFTRLNEYVPQARKVEFTKKTPEYHEIDWSFKFGLGFIGIGLDYTIDSRWRNDYTVVFEGIKGDVSPLFGAWEWVDLQDNSTLLIFTVANHISKDASWTLKLGNKLPNINIVSSLFIGMLIVEKQVPWLEKITAEPSCIK